MKKQFPAMSRLEILLGFALLLGQLLVFPVLITVSNELFRLNMSYALQNFICFALDFLCAAVIFYRYWIQSLKNLEPKPWTLLKHAAINFGFYYLTSIILNILIFVLDPGFSNANDAAIAEMTQENFLMMAIGTVILVPPVEEILYRGVLFGQLRRHNRLLGYLVSVVLFSGIHVIGYIGRVPPFRLLLCFLQYVPPACFLARAYEKSGSIFAPIVIHTVVNFIGISSILMR